MSARVAIRRIESVQRCVDRAREELQAAGSAFDADYTRQDAAILNIVRACDLAIDLANMIVRAGRLGIPAESRDSFRLLQRAAIIAPELSSKLQKMVGFRNLATHDYMELDLAIVKAVIATASDDLLGLAEIARQRLVVNGVPDA